MPRVNYDDDCSTIQNPLFRMTTQQISEVAENFVQILLRSRSMNNYSSSYSIRLKLKLKYLCLESYGSFYFLIAK